MAIYAMYGYVWLCMAMSIEASTSVSKNVPTADRSTSSSTSFVTLCGLKQL